MAFVSLAEGIDATTPAGKLQLHILGAIAEFERARIQERGAGRAKSGRGCREPAWAGCAVGSIQNLASVAGLPTREASRRRGIPRSTLQRILAQTSRTDPLKSAENRAALDLRQAARNQ